MTRKSVPWPDALALVGGESRLRSAANELKVAASTYSGWKERGVPWHVLGPILATLKPPQPARPAIDEFDGREISSELHRLFAALATSASATRQRILDHVRGELAFLTDTARASPTPAMSERSKQPPASGRAAGKGGG